MDTFLQKQFTRMTSVWWMFFIIDICLAANPLLEVKQMVGEESFNLFIKEKFSTINDVTRVFDLSEGRNAFINRGIQMSSSNIYSPHTFYIFNNNFKVLTTTNDVLRTDIVNLFDISKLKPFLDDIRDSIVTSRYALYVFAVNDFVKFSDEVLLEGLQNIWNTKIWSFQLLYYDKQYIDVTYNPFEHKIIEITKDNQATWNQLHKFNNILKYKVYITIYHDPPRAFLDGETFSGNYMRILKIIEEVINATFVIVGSNDFDDAYTILRKHEADFCAIGQFYGVQDGVKYGEPFKRDDLVVVVPKAPKLTQVQKLLNIFNYKVWILLNITYIVFISTIYLITKQSISLLSIQLFGAFCGIGNIFKTNSPLANTLYIGFVFMGLTVSYSYSSSILSALLEKKYNPEINTLRNLLETNLSMFILKEHRNLIPAEFHPQLITVSAPTFAENIMRGNNSIAYVGMNSYVEGLINMALLNRGEDKFHVIQESIVPGFESYIFHEASPFIHKINDVLKSIDESGLFFYQLKSTNKVKEEFQSRPLNMEDLSIALMILILGNMISFAVFIFEKILHACL